MNYVMDFIKSVYELIGIEANRDTVCITYLILLFVVLISILLIQKKLIKIKKEKFLRCKIKY